MSRPPFRVLLIATVLPLVITATATAVLIGWIPDLPDEIAIHWGADGQPDGFASPWANVWLMVGLGTIFPVLAGIFAGTGRRGLSATRKLIAALSLAIVLFIALLVLGTTAVQRGLDDAADTPDLGWFPLAAAGVAVLAGVVGWFVMPPVSVGAPEYVKSPPMRLEPGERAVWLAKTTTPTPALIAMIIGVTVLTGIVVFTIVATDGEAWPILVTLPILVAALALTTSWRLRVDATGLTVRGVFGAPVFRVPVAEVVSAGAIDVSPGDDFGGWGIRWGKGKRFGIITRGGTALEVERNEGRAFVVTVDDAETGAALLAAYAAAAKPTSA